MNKKLKKKALEYLLLIGAGLGLTIVPLITYELCDKRFFPIKKLSKEAYESVHIDDVLNNYEFYKNKLIEINEGTVDCCHYVHHKNDVFTRLYTESVGEKNMTNVLTMHLAGKNGKWLFCEFISDRNEDVYTAMYQDIENETKRGGGHIIRGRLMHGPMLYGHSIDTLNLSDKNLYIKDEK